MDNHRSECVTTSPYHCLLTLLKQTQTQRVKKQKKKWICTVDRHFKFITRPYLLMQSVISVNYIYFRTIYCCNHSTIVLATQLICIFFKTMCHHLLSVYTQKFYCQCNHCIYVINSLLCLRISPKSVSATLH